MAVNVAISGFGRIGRLVLRSIIENRRRAWFEDFLCWQRL